MKSKIYKMEMDKIKNAALSLEDRAAYDQETIQTRIDAGKAGNLWTVEILFSAYVSPGELRRHVVKNLLGNELMKFREAVFRAGLLLPIAPRQWQIIPPADILHIEVFRQEKLHT